MRNIRAASCMEQVKAPPRSYHQQMKRELPVTGAQNVAALVTTSGSQMVVVVETSANDAAAAPTQLLSKLFGANVLNCQATGY